MRAFKPFGLGLGLMLLLSMTAFALPQLEASGRSESLVQAVWARDSAAVAALLARGANPNTSAAARNCGLERRPSRYECLLGYAVENRDGATARLLLQYGAAPFATHRKGKWLLRRDLVEEAKQQGDQPLAVMLRAAQKTAPKAPLPDYPGVDFKARTRQEGTLLLGAPAAAALWGGWWIIAGCFAYQTQANRQPGGERLKQGFLLVVIALLLFLILVPLTL